MPITIGNTNVRSSANITLGASGFSAANLTSTSLNMLPGFGINAYNFNDGALGGYRNKIINGKMEIAQRGTSSTSDYAIDRWYFSRNNAGAGTVSQLTDVPTTNEFQNSLGLLVNTADTSVGSTDYAGIAYAIEGFDVRDLVGKTFTLSFWVKSSKTGNYNVSFRNVAGNRTYLGTYLVSVANTWQQRTITVQGGLPTDGTWDYGISIGLLLFFTLMVGATYQSLTFGSWQAGNFLGSTTHLNFFDAVNNDFRLTGVQLELGDRRTSFEHRPIGLEFRLCQRYYQEVGTAAQNEFIYYQYNTSLNTYYVPYSLPVPMRGSPVAGLPGTWNFANLAAQPNGFSVSASYQAFRINVTPSAAGNIMLAQNSGAGSRISFNSELL